MTRRILDLLLPATVWPIALLAASVALEIAGVRIGIDDLDEGYFVQQATRVLHGQVPYRDFESLYSPGLVYLHAALFAVLGGPSLLAPRGLAVLARAAMALLLYALARPGVRRPFWAAAPALVLLLCIDDAPVRWEPHPGWLSSLFALTAAWCLVHKPARTWLVAAGTAAALAYVFKQNTGIFALAAVLLWSGRRHWRPPLVTFGALTLAWLIPLALAVEPRLDRLGVLIGAVNESALLSAPEPGVLIPLACLAAGLWLTRRDSNPYLRWYLLAGGALFLTEFPRMDTLHLAWSAPLLLVVGAIVLDRLPDRVGFAALVTAVALLAPTWSDRLAYVTQPRAPVTSTGVDAPAQTAADINAAIADIQQRTRAGEPIFVYPTSPLLYVMADRPNPTRFDHLNPGAATRAQVDAVISDLDRADTRVVVVSDFWRTAWGPPGANATLEAWLDEHFREVARYGTFRVLQSGL